MGFWNADAANYDTTKADLSRAEQEQFIQALSAQAGGFGPSAASQMLQQQAQQNNAAIMGAAAASRGINPALAMRNADLAGAQMQQSAAGQAAIERSREQLAAQDLLGRQLTGIRQGDIQNASNAAGLQQSANQFNAGANSNAFGSAIGTIGTLGGVVGSGFFGGGKSHTPTETAGDPMGPEQPSIENGGLAGPPEAGSAGFSAEAKGGLIRPKMALGGQPLMIPPMAPSIAHNNSLGAAMSADRLEATKATPFQWGAGLNGLHTINPFTAAGVRPKQTQWGHTTGTYDPKTGVIIENNGRVITARPKGVDDGNGFNQFAVINPGADGKPVMPNWEDYNKMSSTENPAQNYWSYLAHPTLGWQGGGQTPGQSQAPTVTNGGNGQGAPARVMAEGGPVSFVGKHLTMAKGGKVPALVSPGEQYLNPEQAREVAQGKKHAMNTGEKIPGKPQVPGAVNSYANDTVPKTLQSGGVVVPRKITQDPEAAKKADAFVKAVLSHKKAK